MAKTATTYVALLRGINVGGKNKLAMKDLAALFAELGCTDVKSYIQSGNVVFRASPSIVKSLPARMAAIIVERFAIHTSIILRTSEQLAAAMRNNPFLAGGHAESTLHLVFLKELPSPELIRACQPLPDSQEEFIIAGQEIYLRAPNGLARPKLPNFDRKLSTVGTCRNWRTVTTLLAMMRD